MAYPDRVVYDGDNRDDDGDVIILYVETTDAWVLANKSNTLHMSADKTVITADGVDTATVTVQLKTPRLIDDSYDNVASNETVVFLVDDENETVILDANGSGSFPVASMEVGTFAITGVTYQAEPLIIEAV